MPSTTTQLLQLMVDTAGMKVAFVPRIDRADSGPAHCAPLVLGLAFATLALLVYRPLFGATGEDMTRTAGNVAKGITEVVGTAPLFVTSPLSSLALAPCWTARLECVQSPRRSPAAPAHALSVETPVNARNSVILEPWSAAIRPTRVKGRASSR